MFEPLKATDDRIIHLMKALEENNIKITLKGDPYNFNETMHKLNAQQRTKYIAINYGGSGSLMVDRQTEAVYSIKGYGVPNLKKFRGTVEYLTKFVQACTLNGVGYRHKYWYDLHPTS